MVGTVVGAGVAVLTGWLWFRFVPMPTPKGFGLLGEGGPIMLIGLLVSLVAGIVAGLASAVFVFSRWLGGKHG